MRCYRVSFFTFDTFLPGASLFLSLNISRRFFPWHLGVFSFATESFFLPLDQDLGFFYLAIESFFLPLNWHLGVFLFPLLTSVGATGSAPIRASAHLRTRESDYLPTPTFSSICASRTVSDFLPRVVFFQRHQLREDQHLLDWINWSPNSVRAPCFIHSPVKLTGQEDTTGSGWLSNCATQPSPVKWLCRSHQAPAATSFAPLRSDLLCSSYSIQHKSALRNNIHNLSPHYRRVFLWGRARRSAADQLGFPTPRSSSTT